MPHVGHGIMEDFDRTEAAARPPIGLIGFDEGRQDIKLVVLATVVGELPQPLDFGQRVAVVVIRADGPNVPQSLGMGQTCETVRASMRS